MLFTIQHCSCTSKWHRRHNSKEAVPNQYLQLQIRAACPHSDQKWPKGEEYVFSWPQPQTMLQNKLRIYCLAALLAFIASFLPSLTDSRIQATASNHFEDIFLRGIKRRPTWLFAPILHHADFPHSDKKWPKGQEYLNTACKRRRSRYIGCSQTPAKHKAANHYEPWPQPQPQTMLQNVLGIYFFAAFFAFMEMTEMPALYYSHQTWTPQQSADIWAKS